MCVGIVWLTGCPHIIRQKKCLVFTLVCFQSAMNHNGVCAFIARVNMNTYMYRKNNTTHDCEHSMKSTDRKQKKQRRHDCECCMISMECSGERAVSHLRGSFLFNPTHIHTHDIYVATWRQIRIGRRGRSARLGCRWPGPRSS